MGSTGLRGSGRLMPETRLPGHGRPAILRRSNRPARYRAARRTRSAWRGGRGRRLLRHFGLDLRGAGIPWGRSLLRADRGLIPIAGRRGGTLWSRPVAAFLALARRTLCRPVLRRMATRALWPRARRLRITRLPLWRWISLLRPIPGLARRLRIPLLLGRRWVSLLARRRIARLRGRIAAGARLWRIRPRRWPRRRRPEQVHCLAAALRAVERLRGPMDLIATVRANVGAHVETVQSLIGRRRLPWCKRARCRAARSIRALR